MKKLILALAMVFTLSSAFANEETVKKEVLNAFSSNFSNASEISWTISDTYYITVENANTKLVLKANGSDDWSVFKKSDKS